VRYVMRTRLCAVAALALLALAGCTRGPAAVGAPTSDWSPAPEPADSAFAAAGGDAPSVDPAEARPSPSACSRDGWDCAQQIRFDSTAAFAHGLPGQLGVILHDRVTGAIWRTGATTNPMWTASTIKVAIATTLLERQRAGKIRLSSSDRKAMADMLKVSSNDAADTLWKRYDGPKMLDRFRTGYGMTNLAVVNGEDTYWRNLRCTAEDLDHLMAYVLGGRLHPDDRKYLVDALRGVARNQHWGTLVLGPDLHPGNKDGWALKPDPGGEHWVAHTVGFAGPDERYLIVVMYSLPPSGTLDDGVQAVSDVVATMFGAPTPTDVESPG
jgi:Beta-lactamase enzyme family